MLHWFPTPYPDELLYSVFARYHVRSGNTSPSITAVDLFGSRSICSTWDLPANLENLLSRIDSNLDTEYLISNHTMYPYYASFLLPNQAANVKNAMITNKGSTIHTRAGIAASSVKRKTNLWICSACIDEDLDAYGETYWRRVHQAPGVFICPKHENVLEETNVSINTQNKHEYIAATPLLDRKTVDIVGLNKDEMTLLLKVACITKTLLESNYLQKDNNTIRNNYLVILKEQGFASFDGKLKRDRLYTAFKSKFTGGFLELLQSRETNWLSWIFWKRMRSFHPLRHILIMLFLETELHLLFDKAVYSPFGQGPWLCLNRICPKHHKPVLTSLTITISNNKPVANFHCDCCGFIFSRSGPDKCEIDQFRIGKIKDYGAVWRNKLTELVNEGNRLTDISKKLYANRETVKKYAAELGLMVPWKSPTLKKDDSNKKLERYEVTLITKKERWLELQKNNPEKSKSGLRRIDPGIYAYLYRHDFEWLKTNSPINKRANIQRKVNWNERDKNLLEMAKDVVQNWNVDVSKPTRITVCSIARRLNKLALITKKADKLPRTMEYINEAAEDVESFRKRRVEFIVQKLKEDGEPISYWGIYRRAGIRPTVSSELKRLIALSVTEYEIKKDLQN